MEKQCWGRLSRAPRRPDVQDGDASGPRALSHFGYIELATRGRRLRRDLFGDSQATVIAATTGDRSGERDRCCDERRLKQDVGKYRSEERATEVWRLVHEGEAVRSARTEVAGGLDQRGCGTDGGEGLGRKCPVVSRIRRCRPGTGSVEYQALIADDVSAQRAVLRFNHGDLHGDASQLRVTELDELVGRGNKRCVEHTFQLLLRRNEGREVAEGSRPLGKAEG